MRGLDKSLAHLFLSHARSLKPVKCGEHFANFVDKELVIDPKFIAAGGAACPRHAEHAAAPPRPAQPQMTMLPPPQELLNAPVTDTC